MKDINENTMGGRIRKALIGCKLTTDELARAVGVSQNYISVIERDDRKRASPALLQKIAAVTGASLVWLKDGESAVTEASYFMDIPLLLTIIMHQEQKVTKELVASVLGIDIEAVDRILSGEAEYCPQWESGLSNLAQRLDLPAIRKKMRVLDSFLQQEEEKKRNAALFWSIRKAISKMEKCSFWFAGQPVMVQDEPEYVLYVLQGEDGIEKWSVQYYSSMLDVDDLDIVWDRADALYKDIAARTHVAVAFSDKESYDRFYNYYYRIISDNDARTSMDGMYEVEIIDILLLLVDGATGDVIDIIKML